MVTEALKTRPETEPELNLLLTKTSLEEPLWKSLFQGLDDFFFPKKLPPLVLSSKPIPVKDIWGFYNYKKNGVYGSTVVHLIAVTLIIGLTIWGGRAIKEIKKSNATVTLVAPDDVPPLPPSKTQAGGGGGGGDRDILKASKGKLPKFSMQQIVPPMVVVRNENPKLTAEPTVVVPPQIKLAMNNLPNLGDPMSNIPAPPSNGHRLWRRHWLGQRWWCWLRLWARGWPWSRRRHRRWRVPRRRRRLRSQADLSAGS